MTAVAAVIYLQPPAGNHNNKQTTKKKVGRVLSDSGFDRDLLFHQPKHFPYSTWLVPLGICQMESSKQRRGVIPLKFFEYSSSKWYTCKPDIVEFEKDEGQPVFDLIIGCKSMKELGRLLQEENHQRWNHFADEKHQQSDQIQDQNGLGNEQ